MRQANLSEITEDGVDPNERDEPQGSDSETTVVNVGGNGTECDVYIGRSDKGKSHLLNTEPYEDGWLGNPCKLKGHGGNYTRRESIERFAELFVAQLRNDETFRSAVENLEGERLGCWCAPDPCHGDVIATYVEGLPYEDGIPDPQSLTPHS